MNRGAAVFDTAVLRLFESLGDNCEFGLVQAACGVNQLGFFRFNNTAFPALLRAIETGFEDFDDPQDLRLEVAVNDELIVHIPGYDLRYHTFLRASSVDEERLLATQSRFLSYLARKMRDDLQSGDKIFLRKDQAGAGRADMERLLAALQAHGPNRLLWVVEGARAPVERLGDALLRGTIEAFSTYMDARTFSFDWFGLCREALSLFDLPDRKSPPVPQYARPFKAGPVVERAIVTAGTGVRAARVGEEYEDGVVRLPAVYCLLDGTDRLPGEMFDADAMAGFVASLPRPANPVLLFRDSSGFEALNSLNARVGREVPRLRLPPGTRVFAQWALCPGGSGPASPFSGMSDDNRADVDKTSVSFKEVK